MSSAGQEVVASNAEVRPAPQGSGPDRDRDTSNAQSGKNGPSAGVKEAHGGEAGLLAGGGALPSSDGATLEKVEGPSRMLAEEHNQANLGPVTHDNQQQRPIGSEAQAHVDKGGASDHAEQDGGNKQVPAQELEEESSSEKDSDEDSESEAGFKWDSNPEPEVMGDRVRIVLSDSEADSSDKEDDDEQKRLSLKKIKEKITDLEVDSDDDDVNFPPRTKNEAKELPPVPVVQAELAPEQKLSTVGHVLGAVDLQVVVQSTGEERVLDEGTLLWLSEERQLLGVVDEVFGPVAKPLYSIRFNSAEDVPKAAVPRAAVGYAPEHAKFVLNDAALHRKGYDASGVDDEELPDDEVEFSDDEKEAEAKRLRKQKKRPLSNHPPAPSPRPPHPSSRPPPSPRGGGRGVRTQRNETPRDIPPSLENMGISSPPRADPRPEGLDPRHTPMAYQQGGFPPPMMLTHYPPLGPQGYPMGYPMPMMWQPGMPPPHFVPQGMYPMQGQMFPGGFQQGYPQGPMYPPQGPIPGQQYPPRPPPG